MADYVLSNTAEADLDGIYVYSFETFGETQADAYFLSLRDCLQTLAEKPRMGQSAKTLHAGLLCHRHARHIVYYLVEDGGIFVVRVLHDAMDAPRHVTVSEDR
jgi:toxin ParE1/3/4